MRHKNPLVFVCTFATGFFTDFFSKRYAELVLGEYGPTKVFGDWLVFRYQTNEGIAFSAPITGLPLKFLTLTLIAYVAYYYLKEEKHRWKTAVDAAYALFLAWAVWNGVERIWIGKVTDFIDLKYFANFNVADIIITVSAAFLVAFHFFHERKSGIRK